MRSTDAIRCAQACVGLLIEGIVDVIATLPGFLEHLTYAQWAPILTLAIALYGAFLSTYNLRQASKKDRRVVTVRLEAVAFGYGDRRMTMIQITVTNAGHRPVVASLPTIILPNGRHVTLMSGGGSQNFPARLDDGESEYVRINLGELGSLLSAKGYHGPVKIFPRCSVETGERFSGKRLKLDMRDGTLS
jgi:hypothetical protein